MDYAHVDNVNTFRLLEDIYVQPRNNLVKEFATSDDITSWLRDQWAGLLATYIKRNRDEATVGQIKNQIDALSTVVSALQTYSQEVLRTVSKESPDKTEDIITAINESIQLERARKDIENINFFGLLIRNHGIPWEDLMEIVRVSSSIDDLCSRVMLVSNKITGYVFADNLVSDDLHGSAREINMVRKSMGLPGLSHHEPFLI